ncbi:hypothetical protein RhiirC2_783779 [Rhizophagus irregularis]|uniref:RNase H type-1 domain-containing protein n=1 Tax=Rhizophagus irregularis TaxID=588596 RepID=A0A2N1N025_9GLOM|nr:hypothetical protein RhiirC2_783779 [Rhizophagus irregularis]
MSAVFHLKGSNDIEIGVLIKTSGIDEQNNLIIGHLNIINNHIDFRSSTIQLQKCLGCGLDNIELSNQKTFNCNILVNANDCLIVGIQSNNTIKDAHYRSILNNNNLKAILQTNLLDITDLSYNDFLFKNNWKSYKTTINQSVISTDRLVKIYDNLITKLLDFLHDQNQLLIIQKQLLKSSTRKFEIYTDSSVCDFRSQQCTISFGFIIVKNNMILHSFRSEISYFPLSNKAELLAVISTEIILLFHHENKIRTNNIYWSILREIVVTNNLTLDFIKVKGHSDNYFNNYINKFIAHTDETSNLVFKANNLNNLDYISCWNNIMIECNLC